MASHNSVPCKPLLPTSRLSSPSVPSFPIKPLLLLATLVTCLLPATAVQCTYPNYATTVQPGQSTVLAWQTSSGDMATYDSISATLYCMDLNGPRGGMWRTATTLFKDRGLMSTSDQFKFSVPDCGQLVRDMAVRIVATGKFKNNKNKVVSSQSDENACYFMMNRAAVVPPVVPPVVSTSSTSTPPSVVRPPVVTTDLPVPTVAPPVTNKPSTDSPDPTKTSNPIPLVPSSTKSASGIPGLIPSSGVDPSVPDSGGYPTGRVPHPSFPPLPPIPGSPEDIGETSKDDNKKRIAALLGSTCGGAALVIMVSLLVLRRRQKRRRPGLATLENYEFDGCEKKNKRFKRILGRSKSESDKGHFFRMNDDSSPYDDDIDGATTKPRVLVTEAEALPNSDIVPPPLPALVPTSPSYSQRVSIALAMTPDTFELDSRLTTPSPVKLHDSLGSRRRRSSFSLFDLGVPPSPAFTTSSYPRASSSFGSIRSSSSFEDSPVVRRYWEAAQLARAERQAELEGSTYGDHLPQNRLYSFLSQSSESRKAEILTLGTTTDEDEAIAAAHQDFFFAGGPRKNTLNSMLNKYLGQSFRMSLSSLQTNDTGSTGFYGDGSDVEDARLYGKKSKGASASSNRGPGFRSVIDTDFLDHLHIKSLRKRDRQLEYYAHYYNRNPTISTMNSSNGIGGAGMEQFREDSMVLGTDQSTGECSPENMSYRTSTVPSLTSTNDPFNTFDSDLAMVHSSSQVPEEGAGETNPFDDCYEQIAIGVVVVTGGDQGLGERSNTALLKSFPTPPVLDS
ncbi:hypothetical protein BGZ93_000682 [Podila epicladia]|nr:hypothetical protein BGZ92_008270 [Podila epicladia]KAG0098255.1 hypothetical protein BGZ93_000682 [Podila epicladia]